MNQNTHLIYVIILRLFINCIFFLLLKHNEKPLLDGNKNRNGYFTWISAQINLWKCRGPYHSVKLNQRNDDAQNQE